MAGTELDTNTLDSNSSLPPFSAGIIPWAVFLCLVTLAIWMTGGPEALDNVVLDIVEVHQESINVIPISEMSTEPRRKILSNPPMITIQGMERGCNDCHRLFTSAPETAARLNQHTQIVLNHGLNDRCFNCHDRDDRDRLALRGGKTIPYLEVSRLCAKCHGLTFRDWQKGMHGRTNGYWDKSKGEQIRLECIQCHDPHSPAYTQYKPLPGPHTIRLNIKNPEEDHHMEAVDEIDPLRKWRYMEKESTHNPSSNEDDKKEGG